MLMMVMVMVMVLVMVLVMMIVCADDGSFFSTSPICSFDLC